MAIATAGVLASAMAITTTPAHANPTTDCPIGPSFGVDCIFWGQGYDGSHSGVVETVSDFPVSGSTSYVYVSSGTGQGEYIGNNNGSNINTDTACRLNIWYDPGYAGHEVTFMPHGTSQFEAAGSGLGFLLNNIRSQNWSC
jgi:hypothetical protein